EPVPAQRGLRKPMQVNQCALQTALAQVRPGTCEVRDEIELQEEPFGSRSDQLCIHGSYLEGPALDSSSTAHPETLQKRTSGTTGSFRPGSTGAVPWSRVQRAAEPRCTCSVMRMAVSRARIPASPPTIGGLPVRMQSRKDSISAFRASP